MKILSIIIIAAFSSMTTVEAAEVQKSVDSTELYIAMVVSDFAGKKIQEDCGELVDGAYTRVNSKSCQDTIISIKEKIKPTLSDCQSNLLQQDACAVIKRIDEALDKFQPHSA